VVPTVVTARWTTAAPSTGQVRFWEQGGAELSSAPSLTLATSHEVVLVGLPELVDAQARVDATDAQGTRSSGVVDFETGALPPSTPRPTWEIGADEGLGGPTLLAVATMSTQSERWIQVLDPAGRVVWAWGGPGLETQRARLTRDGKGVVILDAEVKSPGMDLVRVDWDGTERWRLPVPGGHHDFDLVDDDRFLVIRGETREVTLGGAPALVSGDTLVELHRDGGERVFWSVWDHYSPAETDNLGAPMPGQDALEWTHGNFLHYQREAGRVDFTLRNLSVVGGVDLASGSQQWLLRGGPGLPVPLENPHSAWPFEGGLLVFDQGDYLHAGCAHVVRLVGDLAAGEAQLGSSFPAEGCVPVFYLGNAQALDGGQALVGWGSAGMLEEADVETGATTRRLRYPSPAWVLYSERVPSVGLPLD
jgi:hypothetical protein